MSNFREQRWEPAELNGGKLCEITYTILKGRAEGSLPAAPSKPRNFLDACRPLEQAPSELPRSVRIQIPRMLIALYEVRNNRGVGHSGGDVDPNHMDAVVVLYMAKWILAELIRIFHEVDTETAARIVDALVERETPIVWEVGGKKRVLSTSLGKQEMTLLLLYSTSQPLHEDQLLSWLDIAASQRRYYRRDVLRPAHEARMIGFEPDAGVVELSPLGVRFVEQNLPSALPEY